MSRDESEGSQGLLLLVVISVASLTALLGGAIYLLSQQRERAAEQETIEAQEQALLRSQIEQAGVPLESSFPEFAGPDSAREATPRPTSAGAAPLSASAGVLRVLDAAAADLERRQSRSKTAGSPEDSLETLALGLSLAQSYRVCGQLSQAEAVLASLRPQSSARATIDLELGEVRLQLHDLDGARRVLEACDAEALEPSQRARLEAALLVVRAGP